MVVYALHRFTGAARDALAAFAGTTEALVRGAIERKGSCEGVLWSVEWALRWNLRAGPLRA